MRVENTTKVIKGDYSLMADRINELATLFANNLDRDNLSLDTDNISIPLFYARMLVEILIDNKREDEDLGKAVEDFYNYNKK